ncbi:MAG: hypothetical protein A3C00_01810 [Candidatus Jacksonbacteria bacterium RIFCSPHIGHO2_02_FULL_44_25]|nr:MAG: hypothetical protein A3C00_01810 [Candidatus Jacksonbacteria bacterium RIFCSPHIGHO2_02_FULL_44_25]
MHPFIPIIGTIVWFIIIGGMVFAMYELIRIDRKILAEKELPKRVKQTPVYEHRAVCAGIVIGAVLLPILFGAIMRGFSFGKAWFVVSFGFLPWLISSTSVLNNLGHGVVALVALIMYTLVIIFFALVFRHNQKSTYIALSVITVLLLIPLYVLSLNIAESTMLGFHR